MLSSLNTRLRRVLSSIALVGVLVPFSFSTLHAATGEVSLSGSTWTGKVDGVTRYTGTTMVGAATACVANMGSGTVRIYNGGNVGGEIRLKTNVLADCWGNTLNGISGRGIIRARNSSGTGVKNVRCGGDPWFGMYFQTSAGQTFTGISGGAGILMRIDNCAGGGGSNFAAGNPNGTASASHAVETYGINGTTFGTVTATSRGHCGVLLNATTSATGGTVNANRCGRGTGYAAFRTANNNLGPTRLTTVNASNECGRVFYSTTNSQNTTITTVNGTGNQGGIWIGSVSKNVKVNGGTVTGNGTGTSCWTDSNPASYGNVVRVTCR